MFQIRPVPISVGFFVICICTNLALAPEAWAKKYALIAGGGGEPQGPETIFDSGTQVLGQNLISAGYETDIVWDGDHPESQRKITKAFQLKQEPPHFTYGTLEFRKRELIRKINSGEIGPGDQIYIQIQTHGAFQKPPQKTHTVVTNSTGMDFNMDLLQELVAACKKKGVKIAIADTSCFSGASINLSDNYACVITAATTEQYGYVDFGFHLASKLESGQNLEDAFLAARLSTDSPGSPRISTIQDEIISLSFADLRAINNQQSSIQASNGLSEESCCTPRIPSVEKIIAVFAKITQTNNGLPNCWSTYLLRTSAVPVACADTHRALNALAESLKKYQTAVSAHEAYVTQGDQFEDYRSDATGTYATSWSYLMKNLDEEAADLKKKIKATPASDPDTLRFFKEQLADIPLMKALKERLLKSNPEFREFSKINEDQLKKTIQDATKEVLAREKKVYEQYYKALGQNLKNPCRDFVI